jgi:hypothetical protein
MCRINGNQLIGFIVGKKKKHLIIFLGDNKIFFLSKDFYQKKRFFMGQFILGKTETGFSALIKFKVTKKLKTDYSLETNRFKLQFIQKITKVPRKFFLLLSDFSKPDEFFKNISKFFEFKTLIGTNGLISLQGNGKCFVNKIINKFLFKHITSL